MTARSFEEQVFGPGAIASFLDGSVVQLDDRPELGMAPAAVHVQDATIVLTAEGVSAIGSDGEWSWSFGDLDEVVHGQDDPWTILSVPGIRDYGVSVAPADAARFRRAFDAARTADGHDVPAVFAGSDAGLDVDAPAGASHPPTPTPHGTATPSVASKARALLVKRRTSKAPPPTPEPPSEVPTEVAEPKERPAATKPPMPEPPASVAEPLPPPPAPLADEGEPDGDGDAPTGLGVHDLVAADVPVVSEPTEPVPVVRTPAGNGAAATAGTATTLAGLEARNISAWFGTHHVLDRVSLDMSPGNVTALIGPSGCGKSTFLRILNRMHEMIPGASLAGEVLLDGVDIYDPSRKLTDARRQIGMVFQKPNPFPAMSIYDNVVASFRLTGTKVSHHQRDEVVETCLKKAGLWSEVKDRLRQPGGSLSGGQQQRLCIARALAIQPRVLLMDEPCSALDPTSTLRIEQTIVELRTEVTVVIVTHNMQQAARVSNQCAFFLAAQGTPGVIVEYGETDAMFHAPQDERTSDYVNGRFG